MAVYTDTVMILRGHLEELEQALDTATSYHVADDLTRRFKNVGGTHRPSNLTVRLEKALDRVRGYLTQEDDERLPEE